MGKYFLIYYDGWDFYDCTREIKEFNTIEEVNSFINNGLNDFSKKSELIIIFGSIKKIKTVEYITKMEIEK